MRATAAQATELPSRSLIEGGVHAPPSVVPGVIAANVTEGILLFLLFVLPGAINPLGVLAVEPLKASLLRGGAALLAASWLVYRLTGTSRVDVGANAVVRAAVAVVALAGISTALSLQPWLSFFGSFDRGMGWLSLAAGCVVLIVSADLLADETRREHAVTALSLGAIVPCAYFLLQNVGIDPINWAARGAPGSTLGSPTFLGGYLVVVAPFAAYRVLLAARGNLAGWRSLAYAGWLALLLVICAVILLTTIRAPLLGLAAGLIAFGVLARGMRRPGRTELAAGLAIVLVIAAMAVATGGSGALRGFERFLTIGGTLDSSSQRLTVWQDSLGAVLADPPRLVVGFGDEMQPAVFEHREATMRRTPIELWDRAHNLFLDTWLMRGLVGLCALLALIVLGARAAWTARAQGALLGSAILAALVGHLVEVSFAFHSVVTGVLFWFLLGLAASLAPKWSRGPIRRNLGLAGVALLTSALLLPLMAAPGIADAIYGTARRSNFAVGAQLEEQAAGWAPWVEELPRAAGLDWQQVATRLNDPAAATRAEQDLLKAAQIAPLMPVPQVRLTRLYLARGQFDQAEVACEQAIANGPYRSAVWDACADVSAGQGRADEAAARKARADALRHPDDLP